MSETTSTSRWYLRFPGILAPGLILFLIIYISLFPSQAFAGFTAILGYAWWGFKIGLAGSLVCALFLLLHPLVFDLRLRGTPAGQRGRLAFRHLFGLIRLEASGGIHAQELRLGFWRWSWQLAANGRERIRRPPTPPQAPPAAPVPEPPTRTPAEPEGASASERPEAVVPPTPASELPAEPSPSHSGSEEPEAPPSRQPAAPESGNAPQVREAPRSADVVRPEKPTPVPIQEPLPEPPLQSHPAAPAPESPEAIEPLPAPPRPEGPQKTGSGAKPSFTERVRRDLKRLRSKVSDGWRMFRKYANLARRAWRRASPMARRLASDLWQSLHLMPSLLRIRYGLPQAHLTGMTQGLAAPVAGLLTPFSVRFEPVPVFTGTTVHVRAEGGLRIHPWRILLACIVLAATREFWLALRDLWRWRKSMAGAASTAT
ncbi:MAG TPA: hypothetical protein PLP29_16325 [Candidatus Ozemobacteraceae bacterium]|nr:hypothetical protein [Candidatus Ozemobacteraceae bacterium]